MSDNPLPVQLLHSSTWSRTPRYMRLRIIGNEGFTFRYFVAADLFRYGRIKRHPMHHTFREKRIRAMKKTHPYLRRVMAAAARSCPATRMELAYLLLLAGYREESEKMDRETMAEVRIPVAPVRNVAQQDGGKETP